MILTHQTIEPHFEIVKDEHRKNPDANISIPVRSTTASAACDFFSPVTVRIEPGESCMIWSDLKAIMNFDEVLAIFPRSSLGSKGIMLMNTVGIIDADYANNAKNDGNIGFNLYNYGKEPYIIREGDKLVQGVLMKYAPIGEESHQTRAGGFGSTGK